MEIETWMDGEMGGWTDGRTGVRADGVMERGINGRKEGRAVSGSNVARWKDVRLPTQNPWVRIPPLLLSLTAKSN